MRAIGWGDGAYVGILSLVSDSRRVPSSPLKSQTRSTKGISLIFLIYVCTYDHVNYGIVPILIQSTSFTIQI